MFREVEGCFGCGVCVAVCPVGALDFVLDGEGFYRPVLREGCIDCGACRRCCAALKLPGFPESRGSWAAWSGVREGCSSGGVAFELGRRAEGGFCGVRYDARGRRAEHFVGAADDARGSKYLPSDSAAGFREILKTGGTVVGTPCQIASLRRRVGDDGRFLLVDFFCHGVPSMLLWHRYVEDNPALAAADRVTWRDKTYGWHDSYRIRGVSGGETVYFSERHDLFFAFFLRGYVGRRTCYACPFRGANSAADVRVGDMWGGEYADDEGGVSRVVAMTERGLSAVRGLGEVTLRETFSDGSGADIVRMPRLRGRLLRELRGGRTLDGIYKKYEWRLRLGRRLARIWGRR